MAISFVFTYEQCLQRGTLPQASALFRVPQLIDSQLRHPVVCVELPCGLVGRPTPVLLPGESHGPGSLVDYSPRDCKESDVTDVTQHAHTHIGVTPALGEAAALLGREAALFAAIADLSFCQCTLIHRLQT